MSLQGKNQKSNAQLQINQNKNSLINLESNAKIVNSLSEKQQESTIPMNSEKKTITNNSTIKENNSTTVLNTKDIEVLNNIANKLVLSNTSNPNPIIKKKKILNKNASCENVKSLIDTKNKEIEIYNKINNFSIKYADKQNSNLNSSNIRNKSSKKKHSLNNSLNKSTSKNTTPKKNQNKNFNINNNNQNMINIHNINNNSNNNSLYNLNNISSNSFNNSMFQSNRQKEDFNTINESKIRENFESLNKFYNTNSTNNPLLKNNSVNKQDFNTVLNQNNLNNSINMNNINNNLINNNYCLNSELSVKPKKGDHSPHKISKINPILPEDFENCAVSDEDDHLPQSNLNNENLGLNRSIVFKPKPPMSLQNNLIKNYSDKIILEEESVMENNSISKNEVNLGGAPNKNLNESFKNLNNSSLNNGNNAEKNNKELLKALNNMENEINKSSFNNMMNSKSQISNNNEFAKHFENYDLTNLSYDLVKEYSHLKIDKDEEFMKRMLFDIFKRQTKDERLQKIIDKNKIKIDENDRIKAFNRLIEDANRRLEAQEKIEDLKDKINKGIEDEKNYSSKEWDEIYKQRFLNYQSYRENWVKEQQTEKERLEQEKENEIVNSCKTIKKPKKNVEEFCNRMYDEAKRRQIKNMKKKENYENDDKNLAVSTNLPPGFSKDYKTERNSFVENNKNKPNKITTKYNFQNDFNSNQISDNENAKPINRLSNFKESPTRRSLNFSIDLNNLKESPIKNRSKSKENLMENTPLKNRRESDKRLSNTDINNMRFEGDPIESKKSLLRNSSSLLSVSQEIKDKKEIAAYEFSANKSPLKVKHNKKYLVMDYSTNLFSANIKNMHEIQNNNFDISDEDIIKDIPRPYKIRAKKPSYKIVPIMFSNTQMKFLPDHVAFNVVDNILNPKIYDE